MEEKMKKLLLEYFDKLPIKAKELLLTEKSYEILEYYADWDFAFESPIEEILYIALEKVNKNNNLNIYIFPQTEIKCKNGNNYRTDFAIFYDEWVNPDIKEEFALAIECDGYEFHQKTKKQVERDNKREYDLKMNGWEILRFSGSEIYNNPMECADKIIKYVIEKNDLKIEDK